MAAKLQGIDVNSITLFLFGGIASIDKESKTPGDAFKVAIAGPLVSFLLFVLLTGVSQWEGLPTPAQVITGNVAQINLVLTLFNLIPGLPLDGGQVLKAAVWKLTNSRIQGIRWAARSGQILGWIAITLGLVMAFAYQNFSGLWIALIGWFALRNAAAYGQMSNLQEAMLSLKVSDAMARDFRVVDADMTIRQFADNYLLEENRSPVYFAASEGRYRGLVSVEDIRTIERSQWEILTLNHIAKAFALHSFPAGADSLNRGHRSAGSSTGASHYRAQSGGCRGRDYRPGEKIVRGHCRPPGAADLAGNYSAH